jgi:hypothetical protein
VTSCGDRGAIRLEDATSGELFAECPLPRDAAINTVVRGHGLQSKVCGVEFRVYGLGSMVQGLGCRV